MEIDQTFLLQEQIKEIIEETVEKWDNEKSRFTIESFKRKRDYLVILKVGKWKEKHYTFKGALPIKPGCNNEIKKLRDLITLLKNA